MILLTSDVSDYCEKPKDISDAGHRLLAWAVEEYWGIKCPAILKKLGGKPYFPGETDRFFSLSHTGRRVLIGLARGDLGVDIERVRPLYEGLEKRIFSEKMRGQFDVFEAWTLREAVFKLTGQGSLLSMELEKIDGAVVTPYDGVHCRSYYTVPGHVVAAAAYAGDFPEQIENIPPEKFLS